VTRAAARRSPASPVLDAPLPRFKVERTAPTSLTVRIPVSGEDWEQWFLLRSDAHHDNAHCDHALEVRHLRDAVERNAGILDAGDLFCAMEGKWDKRADQNALREELRGNDYLDRLGRYAADFYAPFAPWWVMLSPGNHETAILKHHQIDLTAGLAERMADRTGYRPMVGTYAGWIRFSFEMRGGRRESKVLWYTHGYGGGGPVTLDVIQTNRQAVYLGGVDIVWSGHTHDAFMVRRDREELDHNGVPQRRHIRFVKTPGYKDEFKAGQGYHVEKGRGPKPNGAAWLRFSRRFHPERIVVECQEAV